MSVLINQQDETINAIETTAARVEDDTRGGFVFYLRIPDAAC